MKNPLKIHNGYTQKRKQAEEGGETSGEHETGTYFFVNVHIYKI